MRVPCRKLSPRFIGPFTITQQVNPVTYQPGEAEEPPPLLIMDEGSAYLVRDILDSRRRGGRLEYLVDREGYGPKERSAPVEIGLLLVKEVKDGGACIDRERREADIGKGRELADMMERRKVDILRVQETRWKGSKARSIGAGFKLFYYGVDSKRNGVGVVLKEEFVKNVLEVKRVSDRVMSLKLEIERMMLNVVVMPHR
ncbi:hypothetical protein QTP70_033145 [Hemibagrus guttatus]|uniref:Uncharacterized protein n=1 Tax=Hemibagrus guttatus TaxID=175788 RepID=A0AAE0VBQ7_9TELE|nr:hypothetical protein QTP70_033145 [Hemibagrus guttatus]KAK3573551.1 hypothetical protein QTP86_027471 [Hemibagrus guttatus]